MSFSSFVYIFCHALTEGLKKYSSYKLIINYFKFFKKLNYLLYNFIFKNIYYANK
jgi:hypothetical protein